MAQLETTQRSENNRRQSNEDVLEIDLGAILISLRKHKGFIFFTTAFCTAIAAAYCYMAPPVYRSTAVLLIESEQNQIIQIPDFYGLDTTDQDYFQTQYQMLKSPDLARKVVEKLNLAENEEFNNQKSIVADSILPLIQKLSMLVSTASAKETIIQDIQWRLYLLGLFDYQVTGEMDEHTRLAVDEFMLSRNRATDANSNRAVLRELDIAVAEIDGQTKPANASASATSERSIDELGTPNRAALISPAEADADANAPAADLNSLQVTSGGNNYESELLKQLEASATDAAHVRALGRLISGLDIQTLGKTKLINISFESQSPKMAALIPNAVGRVYIEDYLNIKDEATEEASIWLVERLEKIEVALRESEEKLQAYKRKNKLVDLDGGVTRYNEQELLNLSSKLLDSRRELAEAKILFDEVQRLQIESPEALENLLAVQSSDIVRTYRQERAAVEREIDELSNKYGDKHPRMVDAESRLDVITRNIDLEVSRVVGTIVNNYELSRANVRAISQAVSSGKKEIEQIGEKGFELSQLQREVDANRKLYETFFNRYRETDEARSLESTNARITESAKVPFGPIKPKKSLIMAIAFLGSLIVASIISLLRESFDHSIDTVGGVEKIERKLGVPLVGIIPILKKHLKQANRNEPVCPPESATEGGPFTEAIRTICSSITLSKKGKGNKTIVVTSSIPDEGKSTASVNLAYEFSKSEKTLLIDADFRKPSVHKVFGLENKGVGLTSLLEHPENILDSVAINAMDNLDVLVAGKKTDNPLSILSSENLAVVLGQLNKHYDRIVIDTPPVHAVSDMLYLSKFADSVLYVVRSESTDMKLVERGMEKLRQVEAPVHGIVIAQVDVEKMKRYGASYYAGYYDYYGYS